ncbi:Ras GTPase-activating protein 1 [Borealophlyctis nickersoniae]|nr:Ras GTPase-activating protein 1 [Borealophlyctis nickersoniae]
MTVNSALQYTEESVRQCRELAAFIKKRQAVEAEYAKGLAKVYQSFHKFQGSASGHHQRGGISDSSGGADRSWESPLKKQLYRTSVWRAFAAYVEETSKLADIHRHLAISMQDSVLEPFQNQLKSMEATRKSQAERGAEYWRNLQDARSSLVKAKREYESLQSQATDSANSHSRAKLQPAVKERDVEKLAQRAATASEKADYANEKLQVHEELCKNAEEHYYSQLLPALYQDIRAKEEERATLVRKTLSDVNYLEKNLRDNAVTVIDTTGEHITDIDVAEDIEDFVENHMTDDAMIKSEAGSSVQSLKALKAGKMFIKRGDFISGWKTKYFVLSDDGALYCFDNEEATKPREVISLHNSAVHNLDDSYFGRADCFQLVAVTANGRQVYNLVTGSGTDKEEWLEAFRKFASCCARCAAEKSLPGSPTPGLDVGAAKRDDEFRLVRSLHLSIIEAKEIPGPVNPYCIVLFDDIKQARTTAKPGEAPFWGENFYFTDLCPYFARLRILVFTHNQLQKDMDVGYISIPLANVKPGVRVEQWYQIKQLARTGIDDSPKRGSIRVGFLLTNEKILPARDYEEFFNAVTEPSLATIRLLGNAVVQQREDVAKVVLNLLLAKNQEIGGLISMLDVDIHATESPNIIFRGNTLATKAVDQYMKVVGMEYLHSTLGALVRSVFKAKESCEVDPMRVSDIEDIKRNWRRLLGYVGMFWNAIQKSAPQCPRQLVQLFCSTKDKISQRWPEPSSRGEHARYSAVSGFIFLRFFCPAILSPRLFGIINEHPDPMTARTLTLIAKILQNLANLTEFGNKEPHMGECNSFIKAQLGAMRAFLDTVSTISSTTPSTLAVHPKIDVPRQTEALYQLFSQHLATISSSPQAAENSNFQALIPIIAHLDMLHQRYDREQVSAAANFAASASTNSSPQGSPLRANLSNREPSPHPNPQPHVPNPPSAVTKVSELPPKLELNLPYGEERWGREGQRNGARPRNPPIIIPPRNFDNNPGPYTRFIGEKDDTSPGIDSINSSLDGLEDILHSIGTPHRIQGHEGAAKRSETENGRDTESADDRPPSPPPRKSSASSERAGNSPHGSTETFLNVPGGGSTGGTGTGARPRQPPHVSHRIPPANHGRKGSHTGRALFRTLVGIGSSPNSSAGSTPSSSPASSHGDLTTEALDVGFSMMRRGSDASDGLTRTPGIDYFGTSNVSGAAGAGDDGLEDAESSSTKSYMSAVDSLKERERGFAKVRNRFSMMITRKTFDDDTPKT